MAAEIVISGFIEAYVRRHPMMLLTISEQGFAKRTSIQDYPIQKRGSKGVPTMNVTRKTGAVVKGLMVAENQDVMVVTARGKMIRVAVSSILPSGRKTQGVRLIRLDGEDKVVNMVTVPSEPAEVQFPG